MRFCNLVRFGVLSLSLSLSWPMYLTAQTVSQPTTVDLRERPEVIAEAAARVRPVFVIDPQRRVVVSGDYVVNSWWLAAREIVFEPGGRLVFSPASANSFGLMFVVADRIVVRDPNRPGVITWQESAQPAPGDRGQASSGPNGAGAGGHGGVGGGGAPGITGTRGSDAPSFMVFTRTLANGGLVVDASGGTGGPGGVGQRGGTGGNGAQGTSARQGRISIPFGWTHGPFCDGGPGRGGNGGPGGTGGPGGDGGPGGNGGNVTVVSRPDALPTLLQAVRVDVNSGPGGSPGTGGAGGSGGQGGPEGPLANFCESSGRNGGPGAAGANGTNGGSGSPGRAGQTMVSQLTDEQFASLFGF